MVGSKADAGVLNPYRPQIDSVIPSISALHSILSRFLVKRSRKSQTRREDRSHRPGWWRQWRSTPNCFYARWRFWVLSRSILHSAFFGLYWYLFSLSSSSTDLSLLWASTVQSTRHRPANSGQQADKEAPTRFHREPANKEARTRCHRENSKGGKQGAGGPKRRRTLFSGRVTQAGRVSSGVPCQKPRPITRQAHHRPGSPSQEAPPTGEATRTGPAQSARPTRATIRRQHAWHRAGKADEPGSRGRVHTTTAGVPLPDRAAARTPPRSAVHCRHSQITPLFALSSRPRRNNLTQAPPQTALPRATTAGVPPAAQPLRVPGPLYLALPPLQPFLPPR